MPPRYSIAALAVTAFFNSVACAETFHFQTDQTVTDDIAASQSIPGGSQLHGILVSNDATVSLLGQNISSSMTVNSSWTAQGTAYSFSGITVGPIGDSSTTGAVLNLGGDNTQRIEVNVNVEGTGVLNNGEETGLTAIGLWAYNSTSGDSSQSRNGGQLTVTADDLVVRVHSEDGSSYGVLAQNGTTDTTAEKPAALVINAKNTYIEATSGIENGGVALVAMSEGVLHVNGNLYASGDNVLVARGDAQVRINEAGTNTVQLVGNVNFNYEGVTSGTKIDADVLVNLSGEDSFWNGSAMMSYSPENPDAEKLAVTGMKLRLNDGATWTPSVVGTIDREDSGQSQIAINNLDFNDGVINLENPGHEVEVDTLSGTGGTVNVATTAEEDGTFNTATLAVDTVESTGEAAPQLAMNYTGITADDLADPEADMEKLASQSLSLGENAAVAQTRHVDEGNIRGAVTQTVDADGNVTGTTQAANVKLSNYSAVNAMSLVEWRNEINHLTKRLGDIRASEGTIGAWARVYGGESQWGGANEVEMDHTTIQVGGDYRINNHWIVGGAFSYTDSSADLSNGDADGDSYSIAAYATYTADGGSFLDLIARYGYLKNDITAGNMSLETGSSAFSLSAETGHTFRFLDERAYIEPQIEVTYGFIAGDDDTASNGVRIEQDDFQNLITRVGVRAGFDFPEKKGSLYGMVSYSYDWLGDADGTASQGALRQELSEDLGGGWVTYGIGAQIMMGKSAYFYGELERTSGGDIDNPYLFSAGVRWTF